MDSKNKALAKFVADLHNPNIKHIKRRNPNTMQISLSRREVTDALQHYAASILSPASGFVVEELDFINARSDDAAMAVVTLGVDSSKPVKVTVADHDDDEPVCEDVPDVPEQVAEAQDEPTPVEESEPEAPEVTEPEPEVEVAVEEPAPDVPVDSVELVEEDEILVEAGLPAPAEVMEEEEPEPQEELDFTPVGSTPAIAEATPEPDTGDELEFR